MTVPFSPERWAFEITHVLNAAFGAEASATVSVNMEGVMKRWKWIGDVNAENGGAWIRPMPEYGYADVVRVTPCSDASGPHNCWWIECLTVVGTDDSARRQQAAESCGWEVRGDYAIAEAMLAYGYCEPANCFPEHHSETVCIGRIPEEARESVEPTVVLRRNASLARYVKRLRDKRMP